MIIPCKMLTDHTADVEIRLLRALSTAVSDLLEYKETCALVEDKEWLTTREFAVLVGVKPKTISNRASAGEYSQSKQEDGYWLIHRNELIRNRRFVNT